jgi:hypothetical protein
MNGIHHGETGKRTVSSAGAFPRDVTFVFKLLICGQGGLRLHLDLVFAPGMKWIAVWVPRSVRDGFANLFTWAH